MFVSEQRHEDGGLREFEKGCVGVKVGLREILCHCELCNTASECFTFEAAWQTHERENSSLPLHNQRNAH